MIPLHILYWYNSTDPVVINPEFSLYINIFEQNSSQYCKKKPKTNHKGNGV